MVMPALLLQKPTKVSKAKEHTAHLKRRLQQWKEGSINSLLSESLTIQKRMKSSNASANTIESTSKKFANLMKSGKVTAAVKLLTDNMQNGILPLTDEAMLLLQSKHPDAEICQESAITEFQAPQIHDVVYEELTLSVRQP